jgi:hypothetical protein
MQMRADMESNDTKKRPKGVPEENVYKRTHWTIIIGLLAVIATMYLVINAV